MRTRKVASACDLMCRFWKQQEKSFQFHLMGGWSNLIKVSQLFFFSSKSPTLKSGYIWKPTDTPPDCDSPVATATHHRLGFTGLLSQSPLQQEIKGVPGGRGGLPRGTGQATCGPVAGWGNGMKRPSPVRTFWGLLASVII